MQTNETLKTIHSRRSCRAYQDRQVDRDSLDTVIDAGLWAASGRGAQDPCRARPCGMNCPK